LNTNADALSRVNSLIAEKGAPEKKRDCVIDEETKTAILYEYHDWPMGGHRGMNKIFREIRKQYERPNMKRDVENYVRRCKLPIEQKSETPRKGPNGNYDHG